MCRPAAASRSTPARCRPASRCACGRRDAGTARDPQDERAAVHPRQYIGGLGPHRDDGVPDREHHRPEPHQLPGDGGLEVPGRGAQIRVYRRDHQRRHEPAQERRQRVARHGDLASSAQAAAVADPPRYRRSKSALGLAHAAALHPAHVGARKRGPCAALCASRANAQDSPDVAAEHRRRGDANPLRSRCQHFHEQRCRDRGLAGSNPSFAAWEQNEPYTIALLIKGHPPSTCTDRALSAPAITCCSLRLAPRPPASPGERWRHSHDHVVRRDRERYDLVDARRDLASRMPRAARGRLVASVQHRGGDQHQHPVRHLSLGLGLLDLAGLKRRRRAHRVLRLILDPPPWCGAGTRIRSVSCHGTRSLSSWGARHWPRPLDRHRRGRLHQGIACRNRRGSSDVQGRMGVNHGVLP